MGDIFHTWLAAEPTIFLSADVGLPDIISVIHRYVLFSANNSLMKNTRHSLMNTNVVLIFVFIREQKTFGTGDIVNIYSLSCLYFEKMFAVFLIMPWSCYPNVCSNDTYFLSEISLIYCQENSAFLNPF